MKTAVTSAELRDFLQHRRIGTLPELKKALATSSTMTVFRKLKAVGYLTSYSHGGQYYTLREIPEFDRLGLWSCRHACFSRHGNLLQTLKAWVEKAPQGWSVSELDAQLHVQTKHALRHLARRQQLRRQKIDGLYVYFSNDSAHYRRQRFERQVNTSVVPGLAAVTPEMQAAIVLFYCLLNEKQRRLYAGLESLRQGHGGDQAIAHLLDLDVHTVAKGRRELFSGKVGRSGVRRGGGGRQALEKKRLPSSDRSKNSCDLKPPAIPSEG
jgi:hypothetical protein